MTMTMMMTMMMIVTGEHDVGDHPDAPEVGVQRQGLVVHHLEWLFWQHENIVMEIENDF